MNKVVLAVVAVVLLAGAVYWLMAHPNARPVLQPAGLAGSAAEQSESLGATLYNGAAVANPTTNMQETNPFSAPTNPVKSAYQNPF